MKSILIFNYTLATRGSPKGGDTYAMHSFNVTASQLLPYVVTYKHLSPHTPLLHWWWILAENHIGCVKDDALCLLA